MSDHYHDPSDLKLFPELKKLAPAEFEGFLALDKIVGKVLWVSEDELDASDEY